MADIEPQQANRFSRDMFPPPIPHHVNGYTLQNPGVLPANPQFDAGIPQLIGHVAQGRPRDHQNIVMPDLASGMVDHHRGPIIQYPNVGYAHGIHAQAQPNAAENQERFLFGHAHPVAPVPVQAAFHDPFAHQVPAPVQPAAGTFDDLRVITCTIMILRLIGSAWNRVLPVVARC